MATTHPTATRNALAEAIRSAANQNTDACLIIGTSSLSLPSTGVLAIIPLAAFGAASGGVTTSASDGNDAVATGTGTAAIAIVANDSSSPAASAEVFRGAVGVGSGEVQISSTSIASGDTVALTADVTWTAPS
jgi:hypothetical protein